jgi:hypothetical protein
MTGIGLLVLAIALAAVAVQVWRWPAHAEKQDALLTRSVVPGRAWAGAGGLAHVLLGAQADVDFRRAAVSFLRGRPDDISSARTTEQIVSSAEAAIALTEILRSGGSPARRSQAANLLAVQIAENAILDPTAGARIDAATDLLRRAIRLDPGNQAAKANLELLLRMRGDGNAGAAPAGGFGGFGDDAGAELGGEGY